MSDIAKWGILIVAISSLILTILVLPVVTNLDILQLRENTIAFVEVLSPYLVNCRKMINLFFNEFERSALSGLIIYLFTKWLITITIKVTAWIVHFIFK